MHHNVYFQKFSYKQGEETWLHWGFCYRGFEFGFGNLLKSGTSEAPFSGFLGYVIDNASVNWKKRGFDRTYQAPSRSAPACNCKNGKLIT